MITTPQRGFTPRNEQSIAGISGDMARVPQQGSPRGFTLLIAVILSSVSLALALSLLNIANKQVTLALTSKQSQYAFAASDSALECALYYDQKEDAFNHAVALPAASLSCVGLPVVNYQTAVVSTLRTTTFQVACPAGGVSASITVLKYSNADTAIYSNGYNNCNTSDTRRIERGLRVGY